MRSPIHYTYMDMILMIGLDSKFSPDAPNVVHMTVKPQEIVDEEDAKGTKTQYSRDREASERSPRCRCVIQ
jgi:hypothetical protein